MMSASTIELDGLILSMPKIAPSIAVAIAKIAETEMSSRPMRLWSLAVKYAAIVPRSVDLVAIDPDELVAEWLESIAVITQITLTVSAFNKETSLLH